MSMQQHSKPIVIVGGGVAGLAAGTKLAQAKLPVCVLEAGPALGGRARSFIDRTTCDAVDNGQHALMGCYDEFLALLERVGQTNALTEGAPRIPLWSAERGIHALDCPRLPAPLHFAVGLLRYRQLSVRERLSVALAGHRLVNQPQGDATVSEMLDATGQNARQRNAFWDPVVWATLNAPPNQASAALLATVVQRALMGSYNESRFLLPRVPLSELYADPARKFIEERGGAVRCRTRVDEIDTEGGLCVRSQGEKLPAAAVILAVPPVALSRIGPAKLHPDPALHAATPIVSTTLWLDRPLKDEVPDFLGLVESENPLALSRRSPPRREARRFGYGPGRRTHRLCPKWGNRLGSDAAPGNRRACLARRTARDPVVQRHPGLSFVGGEGTRRHTLSRAPATGATARPRDRNTRSLACR